MVKFPKSVWLSISFFIIIEIILFTFGFFIYPESEQCASCHVDEFQGEQCPCWIIPHRGYEILALGTIPSAFISTITFFLIKKFSK